MNIKKSMETATNLKEPKGAISHKLVLFVDNSTIDNKVNAGMVKRSCFADRIICFNKSSIAMEYMERAEFHSEELPSLIFVSEKSDFLEGFNKLSDRIKAFSRIVVMGECTESKRKEKNIIAYMNKPLHKLSFTKINSFLDKKEKCNFGAWFN